MASGWRRVPAALAPGAALLATLMPPSSCDAAEKREVQSVQAGPSGWASEAAAALNRDGLCVIRSLVPPKKVSAWHTEGVTGAFTRCEDLISGARRAMQVRYGPRVVLEGTLPGQPCGGGFVQGSPGRFHWMPEEREKLYDMIKSQERQWMPMVKEFMLRRGGGGGGGGEAAGAGRVQAGAVGAELTEGDIYMSEAQLLVSVPGSEAQPWHADNGHAGVTVVLPLAPLRAEHGPTQMLPGWEGHVGKVHYRVVQALGPLISWAADQAGPWGEGRTSAVAPAGCVAGDAVVFDSRMLHRGLGNESDEMRPVVVVRYDFRHLRAPGR